MTNHCVDSLPIPKEAKDAVYAALENTIKYYLQEKHYSKAKSVLDFMEQSVDSSVAVSINNTTTVMTPVTTTAPVNKMAAANVDTLLTEEEIENFLYMLVEVIEETDYFDYKSKYTTFQFQQAVASCFDISEYDIEIPNGPSHTRFKWKVLISQAISRLVNRGLLTKESRYYYKLTDSYIEKIERNRNERQNIIEPVINPLAESTVELNVAAPLNSVREADNNTTGASDWFLASQKYSNNKPTIYSIEE